MSDAKQQSLAADTLPGPYPVGSYARALKQRIRQFQHVQIIGEVWNLRIARSKVFFELRDRDGAVGCSMWLNDWEQLDSSVTSRVKDGVELVISGGLDYYPGGVTSSPAFTFLVRRLRVAGDGDLLAQLDRLRKRFDSEGLLLRQKQLLLPALPKTIGIVTAQSGKARDDLTAALQRRGWYGGIVWAFVPVQDRRCAPAVTDALLQLSASGAVDVAVVTRGGGSLADMFAFCDETLCRTVALLPLPVVASIGHHTDQTLLDDVAAVSCSTPTHAADVAVAVDCVAARQSISLSARRLATTANVAISYRARQLRQLAASPTQHLLRQRGRLHQLLREIRASGKRRVISDHQLNSRRLLVLQRKQAATLLQNEHATLRLQPQSQRLQSSQQLSLARRKERLDRLAMALSAHQPERILGRGYALLSDASGEPVQSVDQIAAGQRLDIRLADGHLNVEVATVETDKSS